MATKGKRRAGKHTTQDTHAEVQPELRWRHLPHWLKGGLIGVGVMFIALILLLLYFQSTFYTPPTIEPALPVEGIVAISAVLTYPLRHGLYLGMRHGDTFVQLFVGLMLGFIVNVLIVFGSGAGISFLLKPKRLSHSKETRALMRHTRGAHP
jgi:hypothetical protein